MRRRFARVVLIAGIALGFAAKNSWFVSIAHGAGIPVKVTEFNAAVGGAAGVTNSFATARGEPARS